MGTETVFPVGNGFKRGQNEEKADLIEGQGHEGKTGPRRPDHDEAEQHPQDPRRQHAQKDGEEGMIMDVLNEEPETIGAGPQIEEMAEGEAAHVRIEEVEGEGEDAEDHEVRDAVDRDQGD